MLKHSFIFLDGIGPKAERNIWRSGILCWDDFLKADRIPGISRKRKLFYDRQLIKAKADHDHLPIPGSESWRLYDRLKDSCVFLDIEAVGSDVVLIGVSDGESYIPLVKGHNLSKESLYRALEQASMVVTFNGLAFDVPFLRKFFGSFPDIRCFDLRFCLARLGHTGGLKLIEKEFSLHRTHHSVDVFSLWQGHLAGVDGSLETLIEYNHDDVMNLVPLADFVHREMKKRFFSSEIS